MGKTESVTMGSCYRMCGPSGQLQVELLRISSTYFSSLVSLYSSVRTGQRTAANWLSIESGAGGARNNTREVCGATSQFLGAGYSESRAT